VADALVEENLDAPLAGGLPVLLDVEREDGAELFARVGVLSAHGRLPGEQHARPRRDLDAGHLRDPERGFADDLGIHRAVSPEDEAADLVGLLRRHEPAALPLELGFDLVRDAAVGHDALLRGANRAVVEGLAVQDAADRLRDVGGLFNVGRAVARPDAQRRISGGIGRPDHRLAARGKDDADVAVLEEGVRGLDGRRRDAADESVRRARGLGRACRHLPGLHDAVFRVRVGADDDGVSGLERNQRLVHDRGGRIRRGNERRHDAHRHADLHELRRLFEDADRLHVLDALVGDAAAEQVLEDLVLIDAEARLLDGHFGKPRGVFLAGRRDALHHSVDLLLGEFCELSLGFHGPFHQISDFLYGI